MNKSNNKDIFAQSEHNLSDFETTEQLETKLDEELSKPQNEFDLDLISELSLAVIEAKGKKEPEIDVESKLEEFNSIKAKKERHFRAPKWTIAVAAACTILLCGNLYSVSAWDMNIFSLIVEITRGGVKINFDEQHDENTISTSNDDPYGIIAICNEQGIYTETPHYLPDGFTLALIEAKKEDGHIFFRYEKGEQFITIVIDKYVENSEVGIPSDKHNISEIDINGHTAVLSKEDDQMNVIFRSGGYLVSIFTQDVDYIECDKIINSIM